jgi:hypothetical protein
MCGSEESEAAGINDDSADPVKDLAAAVLIAPLSLPDVFHSQRPRTVAISPLPPSTWKRIWKGMWLPRDKGRRAIPVGNSQPECYKHYPPLV